MDNIGKNVGVDIHFDDHGLHDVVGLDIRFGVHDDVEVVVGTVDSFATVFESFHFVVAGTFRSSFVVDCKAIDCVHCCKVLKVLSVLCVAFSIYF